LAEIPGPRGIEREMPSRPGRAQPLPWFIGDAQISRGGPLIPRIYDLSTETLAVLMTVA
jgi:hypothetical protein